MTRCSRSLSVAPGRGAGGGVSGAEDAAAARVGAVECVSEQDQDADGRPAGAREEGAGAESVSPEGPAGDQGPTPQHMTKKLCFNFSMFL